MVGIKSPSSSRRCEGDGGGGGSVPAGQRKLFAVAHME